MIGRHVENNGVIAANLGTVTLAAGKEAVLTFDNDGLFGVRMLLTASTSQDVFLHAVNTTDIYVINAV